VPRRAAKAEQVAVDGPALAPERVVAPPRAGEALSPATLLSLQRSVGNQAVAGMLVRPAGQVGAGAVGDRALLQREDDETSTKISETTDTGNKYTQELILNKTQKTITIALGVAWSKKGTWADDAAYAAFLRKVKDAAYGYLDDKFKVVCTPTAPGAGAGAIELPIDFVIYDIADGYSIEAIGGTPGGDSFMAQGGGKVFEIQTDGTAEEGITWAHELGHAILGASDEYANPAVPGRVLTNDHSIMANYYAQGKAAAEFKARHFQHIVTEVAKAFAGYTCGLRRM
jgi:hypothetical protein